MNEHTEYQRVLDVFRSRNLRMLQARRAGLSYREISEQFGITKSRAYEIVKRLEEEERDAV